MSTKRKVKLKKAVTTSKIENLYFYVKLQTLTTKKIPFLGTDLRIFDSLFYNINDIFLGEKYRLSN